MTLDTTLYRHGGGGLDLSDIVARGPGKLESRPDLKEPVERIAVWQDELTIQNILGPESQLVQKKITLTGTRPSFVDTVKKASIDSSETIYRLARAEVRRVKETASPTAPADRARRPLAVVPSRSSARRSIRPPKKDRQATRLESGADADQAAPGRSRCPLPRARQEDGGPAGARCVTSSRREPAPLVASATPAPRTVRETGREQPRHRRRNGTRSEPAKVEGQAPAAVAAKGAEPKPTAEPTMIGVADRIWAKVALKPGSELDTASNRRRRGRRPRPTGTAGRTPRRSSRPDRPCCRPRDRAESDTDIREAWLWGNVTLHQESPPDKPENPDGSKAKPKTQDVNGEAVYMDNYRGKGKMLARVYNHNPNGPPRPGPWPLARVADRGEDDPERAHPDGPGARQGLVRRARRAHPVDRPLLVHRQEGGAEGRCRRRHHRCDRSRRRGQGTGRRQPHPDLDRRHATRPGASEGPAPAAQAQDPRRPSGQRQGPAHHHLDQSHGVHRAGEGPDHGHARGQGRVLRLPQRQDGGCPAQVR